MSQLKKRSQRANLRILNVPEDSKKGQSTVKFVSNLLMEVMPDVFDKTPEQERAHRSLGQKPFKGKLPRPFVVCFHKFQEKEKALQWARTHDLKLDEITLRMYPNMTAALAKKRAAFKEVKQLIYEKNVRFSLLY